MLAESTERVGGHAVLPDGTAVFVPLGDAIDVTRECQRLGTEADRLGGLLASQAKKLGNEQFVARAPADVVAREREKLTAWTDQRDVLLAEARTAGMRVRPAPGLRSDRRPRPGRWRRWPSWRASPVRASSRRRAVRRTHPPPPDRDAA